MESSRGKYKSIKKLPMATDDIKEQLFFNMIACARKICETLIVNETRILNIQQLKLDL